jgi:broad specificity phosphatase PhoE
LIIVSPLKRARDTLELSLITSDHGTLVWDCVREFREHACDFLETDADDARETADELAARVDEFTDRLRERPYARMDRILVVSHCEFIHQVTCESPHNGERVSWRPIGYNVVATPYTRNANLPYPLPPLPLPAREFEEEAFCPQ